MKPSNLTKQPLSKLTIFSLSGVQMKTFHITWVTFFFCFFGWFGLAPLMPIIREDLGLSKAQVGNTIIAAVSMTIFARLIIGKLCDTWGPRLTYTALLIFSAIPVMGVALANSYESFLLFRLGIGVIGASFVITQFHTSMMFAPNIKGTANAVAGGWGNLGGGITNMLMPVIFGGFVSMGFTKSESWRLAMFIPGIMLLIMAFIYYRYTEDTPAGNYKNIERQTSIKSNVGFAQVAKDWRVWALCIAYAASFGMEITFDGVAALHFVDTFGADLKTAGLLAGVFGFMNIFARAVGGIVADKVGLRYGLKGKGILLAAMILLEGIGLIYFSQTQNIIVAITSMLIFAMFLKMANGTNYAIVPFLNPKAVGIVSGIVGAGGNVGGMLMGFLFKSEQITYAQAFYYIGVFIAISSVLLFFTRYEKTTALATEDALLATT
jgi:MFS transporter, NNP family, nitrate/nitrite transporter